MRYGRLFPVLLFAALNAHAAVMTVGPPPCTHTSLSAAMAAAESNPGSDVIRLRSNATYSNAGLLKQAADELTIEGGYASCSSSLATGVSVLRGASGRSVIRQRAGRLTLRDLYISGGSPNDGLGGGVHASGAFIRLDLERVSINGNSAVNGGGLYVDGTSAALLNSVSANTLRVEGNSAKAGGGIYLKKAQMLVTSLRVRGNLAYRDGGGLLVDTGASVLVQAGPNGDSAIADNRADRDGGAATVRGDAVLWLAHSDAKAKEMTISGNSAGSRGGAFYIENSIPNTTSVLVTQGINLIANRAPLGAVYSAFASMPIAAQWARVIVGINDGSWTDGHQPCAVPASCDVLSGNTAAADDGSIGLGAIGYQDAVGNGRINAAVDAATLSGNVGYNLFEMHSPVGVDWADNSIDLRGSLVFKNSTRSGLFAAFGSNTTRVVASTITDNLPGASIFMPGKYLALEDSIIHEVTQKVLDGFDQFNGSHVLVADPTGLPDFVGLIVADPQFVDAGAADYHLRRESIALDRTAGTGEVSLERDHRDRQVDLPDVAGDGKQDLGCYERQLTD